MIPDTPPPLPSTVRVPGKPGIEFLANLVPPLVNGDRLTRPEFERRYNAMPGLKKAELIEGVVYVPSPVGFTRHARPTRELCTWLGHYGAYTPGTEGGDNATVRLDLDSEPQPDALHRIAPGAGGQSSTSPEGYVVGAPELAVEVAASSVSYDLHDKLRVYRRHGVREYIVWRVDDAAIDWFHLEGGAYKRLEPGADGVVRSLVFPGLWLDTQALLAGDLARVLSRLGEGLRSPEHAAFVARLEVAQRSPSSSP